MKYLRTSLAALALLTGCSSADFDVGEERPPIKAAGSAPIDGGLRSDAGDASEESEVEVDSDSAASDSVVAASDSGGAASDSVVTATDSGVSPIDSGGAALDSSGTVSDAGVSPIDSGVSPVDSGGTVTDTGSVAVDTGTAVDTGAVVDTGCKLTEDVDELGYSPWPKPGTMSWDHNCDGVTEKRWSNVGSCSKIDGACVLVRGWAWAADAGPLVVPACGARVDFVWACDLQSDGKCKATITGIPQTCR